MPQIQINQSGKLSGNNGGNGGGGGHEPPQREIASARKNITDQERQLAGNATNEYQHSKNESCLQLLKRLSDHRPHDARVSSNKALVEYKLTNFSKTDEYIKQMNAARKQLEFGMVNTGDELDDIDRSFLLYNEAVLNFHLRKLRTSVDILERLFKIIEPLDDRLAIRVCILLVELYLLTRQIDQAHGMITYIESTLFVPKATSTDGKMNDDYHVRVHKDFCDSLKPNIHMFKVRVYLERRFLSQCKRELKLAMNSSNNSAEALFLKSNMEYLLENYTKSIKLLNSAPKMARVTEVGHALSVMYFNNMCCIHFAINKYNLALFYSRKALEENISVMKSLPPMEKFNNQQSGRPLQTLAVNKRSEIVYNMGISLLFADKPAAAFECLMEAQSLYQCNPRFWLRLAECCVAVCQQLRNEHQSSRNKKSEFIRGVLGASVHRKLVVSPTKDHLKQRSQEGQSAAMPAATLEFANICLTNALLLLPPESQMEAAMEKYKQLYKTKLANANGDEKEGIKNTLQNQISVEAPPGRPLQTVEAYSLRVSILACHAYVTLGLGDYNRSLQFSERLLKQKHPSGPHKFLAHMYRAESLIKLDKLSEAITELNPENLSAMEGFDEQLAESKSMKPFPKSISEARSMFLLNLASAHALKAEFDKSKQILRQLVANKIPAQINSQAVLLSVYIELRTGNVPVALNLLKRGEVFQSGRLIDRIEAARMMQQHEAMFQANQEKQRNLQQQQGFPGTAFSQIAPNKAPGFGSGTADLGGFPGSGSGFGGFPGSTGAFTPIRGPFPQQPAPGFNQAPGFSQAPGGERAPGGNLMAPGGERSAGVSLMAPGKGGPPTGGNMQSAIGSNRGFPTQPKQQQQQGGQPLQQQSNNTIGNSFSMPPPPGNFPPTSEAQGSFPSLNQRLGGGGGGFNEGLFGGPRLFP